MAVKRKRVEVDPETFVSLWQTKNCVREVAESCGMTPAYAYVYATRLKAKGVKLRRMPGRWSHINVEKLNAIIEKTDTSKGAKK